MIDKIYNTCKKSGEVRNFGSLVALVKGVSGDLNYNTLSYNFGRKKLTEYSDDSCTIYRRGIEKSTKK